MLKGWIKSRIPASVVSLFPSILYYLLHAIADVIASNKYYCYAIFFTIPIFLVETKHTFLSFETQNIVEQFDKLSNSWSEMIIFFNNFFQ